MDKGELRTRVRGGLLGAALGDALGLPVEFASRAELDFSPLRAMRGGGAWGQEPGTYSDDTALSLCLAESIVKRGFEPEDFAERGLAWLREGYWSAKGQALGVGGTTLRSLAGFEAKRRAGEKDCLSGGGGERDNGNGALMRILPASIFCRSSREPLRLEIIGRYTAVTHAHPRALLASWLHCLVTKWILEAPALGLSGEGEAPEPRASTRAAYLSAMAEARDLLPSLPQALRAEAGAFARILDGGLGELGREQIRSSGYVVDCLEAALWCLLGTRDHASCALAAVNLGGDADTTAAVAGGLAGLAYGEAGLAPDWLALLSRREEIVEIADRLAECSA